MPLRSDPQDGSHFLKTFSYNLGSLPYGSFALMPCDAVGDAALAPCTLPAERPSAGVRGRAFEANSSRACHRTRVSCVDGCTWLESAAPSNFGAHFTLCLSVAASTLDARTCNSIGNLQCFQAVKEIRHFYCLGLGQWTALDNNSGGFCERRLCSNGEFVWHSFFIFFFWRPEM